MRTAVKLASAVATVWLAVVASPAAAQSDDSAGGGRAIGPSSEFRVYVGMWTTHLRHLGTGIDNNWLVGVTWHGLYGGTFVNSYGNRAFAAGFQRTLARGDGDGTIVPGLGYRLGFVTGYDQRFVPLAGKTPVLPMAQLVGDVGIGRAGFELAWAGIVASVSPSVRF